MFNGRINTIRSWTTDHANGRSTMCRQVNHERPNCINYISNTHHTPSTHHVRAHAGVTAQQLHGPTLVDQPMRVRNHGSGRQTGGSPSQPHLSDQQVLAIRERDLNAITLFFEHKFVAAHQLKNEAEYESQQQLNLHASETKGNTIEEAEAKYHLNQDQRNDIESKLSYVSELVKHSEQWISGLWQQLAATEHNLNSHYNLDDQERRFRLIHDINLAKEELNVRQQACQIRAKQLENACSRGEELKTHIVGLKNHQTRMREIESKLRTQQLQQAEQKRIAGQAPKAHEGVPPSQPIQGSIKPEILSVYSPEQQRSRIDQLSACNTDKACREAAREKHREQFNAAEKHLHSCSTPHDCLEIARNLRVMQDRYNARIAELQHKAETDGIKSLTQQDYAEWIGLRGSNAHLIASSNRALHRAQALGGTEETTREITRVLFESGIVPLPGGARGITKLEAKSSKSGAKTDETSKGGPAHSPAKRTDEVLQGYSLNKNGDLLGKNGSKFSSNTIWKGDGKERLDVENPNPGQRAGQIHYQDNNENKYYYNPVTKTFPDAPKKVNNLLNDNEFKSAIDKGMHNYLGEKK